jgi:hypothetical protein
MTAKIATALHSVMEACGYVQKTGKNAFHGYKNAGEADLLDKLRPAMVQHGLLLLPSGKSVAGPDEHGNVTVAIEYTLAHKDGEIWPEKLVAFGCGNDRAKNGSIGDKGVYKALTGANKYLLFKLFQIETGDDPEQDDGAHESAPTTGRNAAAAQDRTSSAAAAPSSSNDKALSTATLFAAKKCTEVEELRGWWGGQIPQLKRNMSPDGFDKLKADIAAIAESLSSPFQEAAE